MPATQVAFPPSAMLPVSVVGVGQLAVTYSSPSPMHIWHTP